jgi:hypothetical protein
MDDDIIDEDLRDPETLTDEIVHWQPTRSEMRASGPGPLSIGSASGAAATGAGVMLALAVGAVAIGALAIGALAIGQMRVGRMRLGEVEIDNLIVHRITRPPLWRG